MSDPKVMFKTNSYDSKIVRVDVVKATNCFITYLRTGWNDKPEERRVSRDGFFETWDEAHKFLMGRAMDKVESKRRQLELANAELGNIKGMKNPEA